ncbi:hypothetical protein HRD49_24435 [Corallococcus exiguus]|uniref:hypothetical protein n=1 Tax=Corallococcus exiguus TaxID=83462 RepID=UPI00155F97BE|nr:hypothetical protein [Corallococcus exiguus]NRD64905.1 hypothetical protein [Corallococcus exiguus]
MNKVKLHTEAGPPTRLHQLATENHCLAGCHFALRLHCIQEFPKLPHDSKRQLSNSATLNKNSNATTHLSDPGDADKGSRG